MAKITRPIMRFARWKYSGLILLVLVTLVLHLVTMFQPAQPVFDELHYVPDARLIMQGDPTQRPEHPPLSKLMIIAGMKLFGDNPIGWRFFPILASTASLVFFYLICRRLKLSTKVSYFATFLLGLENLSFIHGHIAMLDIYTILFMMVAFWLYLRENYVLSGAAIALGAMAKLTGIFVLPVIGLHWLLIGGLASRWKPKPLSARLKERATKLLWQLGAWALVAADVLIVLLLLAAAWLYYKGNYVVFGFDIRLSRLGIATGALSILLILLHSVFSRPLKGAWQLAGRSVAGLSLGLGRRWYSLWLFLQRSWHRIRVLPVAIVAGIVLLGLMPLLDLGVFHGWSNVAVSSSFQNINPVWRLHYMSDAAGMLTNRDYPGSGSRPWIWVLTPEVMPYWVVTFWIQPHYIGMISPTIWVFIMPLVLYMVWKAIRGNMQVLLPLCWFLFIYMIWIPTSLITDRITYLFYFYPTVGAMAMGLAIVLAPLLGRTWGRWLLAIYLLLHVTAFVLLSPVAYVWSIPLCLAIYAFSLWYLGLIKCIRFRRKPKPEAAPPITSPIDITPAAA